MAAHGPHGAARVGHRCRGSLCRPGDAADVECRPAGARRQGARAGGPPARLSTTPTFRCAVSSGAAAAVVPSPASGPEGGALATPTTTAGPRLPRKVKVRPASWRRRSSTCYGACSRRRRISPCCARKCWRRGANDTRSPRRNRAELRHRISKLEDRRERLLEVFLYEDAIEEETCREQRAEDLPGADHGRDGAAGRQHR